VDFSKLTREDLMVFAGGILLFIGLIAFPWHSYSFGPVSIDRSALESPDAIWGILAMIVTVAILVDAALERFSPATVIPTTQYGRAMTRVGLCALLLLLLLIKFVATLNNFGWGFFIDVILAIVVATGCWLIAQGKSTPLTTAPDGRA
jgi:hypothetical protein